MEANATNTHINKSQQQIHSQTTWSFKSSSAGSAAGRTEVFGGDGLEADDLQSSGSQNQLAAPRVEVLQRHERDLLFKLQLSAEAHLFHKVTPKWPDGGAKVNINFDSVKFPQSWQLVGFFFINIRVKQKYFKGLNREKKMFWRGAWSWSECLRWFPTLRRSDRRVSMSVAIDGMSLTHWQYSRKIRISSRTVLNKQRDDRHKERLHRSPAVRYAHFSNFKR